MNNEDIRPALRYSAYPASRLKAMLSLDDFEGVGRRFLPRPLFGYVSGAAETNASERDNRGAFQEFGFVPRTLRNVSARTATVRLFGHEYAAPFGIAPMGLGALMAYRGDIVLAAAAEAANIPMVVSGSSLIRLEDVAKAAPASWFQAYLPGEPDRISALVERVARAGYGTLVLTVDTIVQANRENNVRTGFSTPLRPSLRLAYDGLIRPRWLLGTFFRTLAQYGMPHFENSYATRGAPIVARNFERDFGQRDHLNWDHLLQIRREWSGHLVVKGLMDSEDVRIAREIGADGVILSNHGGRQLDGTIAPLRALPDAVAVAGDMPVMIDGGIRRGSDVLKAIALGAHFVFVGRPFMYAASAFGRAGVAHAIDIMKAEIFRDMGLLGVSSLEEMTAERLRRIV